MANEEFLLRIAGCEEEARKMQEQLQIVNQQIFEFDDLIRSIEKISHAEEEILMPLGKGIFIKSKALEKELFVNIGNNVVLKKNFKDIIEIINRQIVQLEELKTSLENSIENISMQFQALVEEANRES